MRRVRGVFVFSPDGTFFTSADMKGIYSINHALMTSTDSWTFFGGMEADSRHCIYNLNDKGVIQKKFGHERGSGPNQLNKPLRLILEGDEKYIFVIDYLNARVLVLTYPTLKLQRIVLLLDSGRRSWPTCFCIVKNKTELYVSWH